jgi:hypothetical protein
MKLTTEQQKQAAESITEEVRDVLNFWLEEYGEGEEEA